MLDQLFERVARDGLNPVDVAVLHTVDTAAAMPPGEVVSWALRECEFWKLAPTRSDVCAAVEKLVAYGYLLGVTEAVRSAIVRSVEGDGARGPTDAYPSVGEIDFTLIGGQRWDGAIRDVYGETRWRQRCVPDCRSDDGTTTIYGGDEAFLVEWLQGRCRVDAAVARQRIVRVGPWRERWWRRFEWGYAAMTRDFDKHTAELLVWPEGGEPPGDGVAGG